MEPDMKKNLADSETYKAGSNYDPHAPMIADAWDSPVAQFQRLLSSLYLGEV